MTTHGTIIVKADDTEMFLHAYHDGHSKDAIEMLLTLPQKVAEHHGFLDIVAERKKPTRISIRDHIDRALPFEWFLPTIVQAITFQHWDRWTVLPPAWINGLPDYYREPDFKMDVSDPGDIRIEVMDEPKKDKDFLKHLKSLHKKCQFSVSKKGIIAISYLQEYEDALLERALALFNAQQKKNPPPPGGTLPSW